jgi:asparagine synthase (glutamine-hydrolysing)
MCGITGFWTQRALPDGMQVLSRMTDAIRHRGPDDQGQWCDERRHVFLGQRRLSILDLSAAGHQPMPSACGRYQMVYNGEIYNHPALRKELEASGQAPAWRGHSDSETLLAAITAWGFEHTLTRLNGMFALAVWDEQEHALLLARDRMGEKPLYYGYNNGVWLFGSELHALRKHPAWCGDINREALAQYLRHACVPAPLCIHAGINKLAAAHWLRIDSPEAGTHTPKRYWQLDKIAVAGVQQSAGTSDADNKHELEQRLTDAVSCRMLSDVPLGAFLSGGYDSSLIVAIMQRISSQPVQTFTIGFNETGFDEAPFARAVARHLGTRHTEMYIEPADAMAVIPQLPHIWDEPFADSSQIPTYLVSKLARESVTVSLSGDGGDELFYGYTRFDNSRRLWQQFNRYPLWLKRLLASLARRHALPLAETVRALAGNRGAGLYRLLARVGQAGEVLDSASDDELYRRLLHTHRSPPMAGEVPPLPHDPAYAHPLLQPFENRMQYADMLRYLPDTILTKVDRASMAVGLESRAPFLDHNLVEFAWRVPLDARFRHQQGKWLLRQLLHEYVPAAMVERPKMGFGVPIDQWLRGPLRDWAEQLLDSRTMQQQGWLDAKAVQRMWRAHKEGLADWQYQLWTVLMFQAWLEVQQLKTD